MAGQTNPRPLISPNTVSGIIDSKAVTPQMTTSVLEKPLTKDGLVGSDTMDSSHNRISYPTSSIPRLGDQRQKGFHSIEPLGAGSRNRLHESGSDENAPLSSISPNQFSVNLSHNNPHSVSNVQLPRVENTPLHGNVPNIKIY